MNNIRIKELENLILEAKKQYYIFDEPIMSDDDFDLLIDELTLLDSDNKILKFTGADIKNKNNWPVKDLTERMGSLKKVNSIQEFKLWYEKQDKNSEYYYNPKADGASIQLKYENGNLVSAITRGNGYQGEDIFDNALLMKNVKRTISQKETTILKGEIVIKFSDFENIKSNYANARNAASGISKQKEGKNCQYLTILYYSTTIDGTQLYYGDCKRFLEENNLESTGFYPIEINDIDKIYKDLTNNRNHFGFLIDGLVIKENVDPIFDGNTPTNQIALKFPTQKSIGIISEIKFQRSRTNRLNPVAIFKNPVYIDGTNISRASLGSWQLIQEKRIFPGSTVEVEKANDVIPQVTKVLSNVLNVYTINDVKNQIKNQNIYINGRNIYCEDVNDFQSIYNQLNYIFGIMEIKNISGAGIKSIIDNFNIKESYEFFDCDFDKLKNIDGWGNSKITTLKQQINEKKKVSFKQFLQMLNVPFFASSRITEICNTLNLNNLDDVYKISIKDLLKVKSIQDNLANSIYNGLAKQKEFAYELIKRVIIDDNTQKPTSDKLNGLKFCITGKTRMKRKEFEKIIEMAGGLNKSINSSNYLITNDSGSGSSKNKKATKLRVKIISEDEFFKKFNLN